MLNKNIRKVSEDFKYKKIAPNGKIKDDLIVSENSEDLMNFLSEAEKFVNDNKQVYFEIRKYYPEVLNKKMEYTSGITTIFPLAFIYLIVLLAGILGAIFLIMRLCYINFNFFNTPGFEKIFTTSPFTSIAIGCSLFCIFLPGFQKNFIFKKTEQLQKIYKELTSSASDLNTVAAKFITSFNNFTDKYYMEDDKYFSQGTIALMKNLIRSTKYKTWKDILNCCDATFNYKMSDYTEEGIVKATEDFSIMMLAVWLNKVADLNRTLLNLGINIEDSYQGVNL